MKQYPLCFGNISNKFTIDNMKKKTVLNGYVYGFSVVYNTIDISDIWDIHNFLMKMHDMI